ncbi:MAG: SIR2 family protein [Bacteroidia bacterium]|nr:SIR2 family protein [Bacteroidia bacterium]
MSKYLKYFPKPFLEDLVNNKCIPIIGAGFSKNANIPDGKNMPDWYQLGKLFNDELIDYQYVNTLDSISSYAHEYSRVKLIEKLHEYLLIDLVTPGKAHRKFADLPFNLIVTTNFEFLLEKSYEVLKYNCLPMIDENQLSIDPKGVRVRLLKLHGDLNHPERLVATEEDYDKFLEKYPLISTFLSNLLIEKTPFFIGYSLDDPDFRQIFQIIKERLGDLRRPAYTIGINSQSQTIARFERRGVKVIDIPGNPKEYPNILAEIFVELKDYWMNKLIELSTSTEDDSSAELKLPKDATSRLCLFLLPLHLVSFYKETIFPIAERLGFTPIMAMDVIAPGENWIAKVSALIERAELIVADVASTTILYELTITISRRKEIPRFIVVMEKGKQIPVHLENFNIIYRPNLDKVEDSNFISQIEEWFEIEAEELRPIFEEEPSRLLNKGEYKASVISSFTLLEIAIRNKLNLITEGKHQPRYLTQALGDAVEFQLITKEEYLMSREWLHVRNRLVHTDENISNRKLSSIARGLIKIIRRINRDEI